MSGARAAPQRRVLPLVVLLAGLVATALIVWASETSYRRSERHLVRLQATLTASALAVAPVDVERRLGSAVVAAAADGGRSSAFLSAVRASTGPKGPFRVVALFRSPVRPPGDPSVLAVHEVAGAQPAWPLTSAAIAQLVDEAARAQGTLVVRRFVDGPNQGLAYLLAVSSPSGALVGYAQQALPTDRRTVVPASSPDSDLEVAIYYGTRTVAGALIETNSAHLPLRGTTASVRVPFGNAVLTLVVTPRSSLAGGFAKSVPWWAGGLGALLSAAFAVLADRLVRRRVAAETLAAEVSSMYEKQRDISEALQHSLLPQGLPELRGWELAVRYRSGTGGTEVGGDWYDVLPVDERTAFFAVGDVAGRGLEAAVVMSSLRNAINALACDGQAPAQLLPKLNRLLDVGRDGRFATVVCGRIDLLDGSVTVASAGHPPPFLHEDDRCRALPVTAGPPLGLPGARPEASLRLRRGSTLVAYTDGLVERRGETLSTGLRRLGDAVESARTAAPLGELLDSLLDDLAPGGASDDIALLGIRWLP